MESMRQGWGLPRGRAGALFALALLIVGLVGMHSMITGSCADASSHHSLSAGAATPTTGHHETPDSSAAGAVDRVPPVGAAQMCLAILLGLLILALLNRHVRPPQWSAPRDRTGPSRAALLVADSLLLRLGVLRL